MKINRRKTGRKKPSRAQRSIRKLTDLKALTGYGIETYTGHEIAYFSLKPSNLSVLTPESVRARINALMNVLKGVAEITMLCLSSRENYAENKRYLRERIEDEPSEILQEQLRQDILLLDSEQTSMATAREFFLVLHLREQNKLEIPPYLSHVEQIVREQGFTVRRSEPEDIMRIYSMYFEQNTTSDVLEAFDGERFVMFN
ncbi:hypothetical protein LJC63_10900 [Ruminococcaceae bacterium OttesenSCG-928-L11]|nr:hypothetical protein [Ruminococcaceae bacterium OttesenSCG-928-L11]